MVLLVLAFIWAAALLPPLVRARLEGNPADSVGRFRRHLRILESTGPAATSLASDMPKAWADEASRLRRLRRRQQIARTLLAVMGSTLVIGLIPGLHMVLVAQVASDVVFAVYAFLLIQARNVEAQRRARAQRAALREQQAVAAEELRQQALSV